MTSETCSYPGHEGKAAAYIVEDKSVCQACYRRFKRNGSLTPKDRYRAAMTEEEIFGMRKITEDGCWLFTPAGERGSIDSYGYGRWYESDRYAAGEEPQVYAHRWAFERWIGPIPDGMVPDHQCHDPLTCNMGNECPHRRCFNPDHLKARKPGDNILRGGGAAAVNARKTTCGEGHPFVKEEGTKNYWMSKDGKRKCIDCFGPGLGRGSANRLKDKCAADHEYTEENTYVDPQGNRHCRQCRRRDGQKYYREHKKDKTPQAPKIVPPKHTDAEYAALSPEVREIVDFFEANYEDPQAAAQGLLAYAEKHNIKGFGKPGEISLHSAEAA